MITELGVGYLFKGTRLLPNIDYGKFKSGWPKPPRILHYDDHFFDIDVFVDLIIAEYRLREIVQQEQSLKTKVRVLKKIAADDDEDKETQYDEELTTLLRQYSAAEYNFYLAETMIPTGPIKQSYETLRQNPTWYLREELVDDCVKRRGCCSRNCGCCQIRHETTERSRGLGHCTPTCGCCSIERGIEHTAEERQGFVDDFKKRMYADNPACVIQMAEAFFLPPLVEKTQQEPQERPQEKTQEETQKETQEKPQENPKEKRTQCQGGKKQWWKQIFTNG
ncbi:unnamed protein product [Penicillium nalgiovense]|nr:unnamed protein product [Penicillium nalgiovense]